MASWPAVCPNPQERAALPTSGFPVPDEASGEIRALRLCLALSIAGLKPYATGSAYVTSKFAVHGLSETLRLDYAGRGIRVTEIMPGLVRTGFAEQRLGDATAAAEFYDSFDACLSPEDIAETVLFALRQPRHVEIAQLVVLPVS